MTTPSMTDVPPGENSIRLAANVGTGEGSIHRACEARIVQLEAALRDVQPSLGLLVDEGQLSEADVERIDALLARDH
jgi:hypothetical protein